jgi:hypothetical protein
MRYLKSFLFAAVAAAAIMLVLEQRYDRNRWESGVAAALVLIPLLISWRRPWKKRRRRSGPPRIPIPAEVRRQVYARDRYTCAYCGRGGRGIRLTIDHVFPVALGGTNEIGNLVTACRACNMSKGAKVMDTAGLRSFAQERKVTVRRERRESCLRRLLTILLLATIAVAVGYYLINVR